MKKTSIILWVAAAAMSVTVASCQDESGFVEPGVTPQLPALTSQDLSVTAAIPATINLQTLNDGTQHMITLGTATVKNLPEGAELVFKGQIGREDTFEHSADIICESVAKADNSTYDIQISADALEGAYVEAIGKSAKPKDVFFRLLAVVQKGTETAYVGNPQNYLITGKSNITPIDLGIVIEDGYNLLGTINGWSVANAVPLTHSGADVYDDPIFTIIVNVTPQQATDGYWWKIVPNSTKATGNWVDAANASFGTAVNGSDALDGNLVPRTDTQDCGAGCLRVPGLYKLVLDMENQTYKWEPQATLMYLVGDLNSWSHSANFLMGALEDAKDFYGYANLAGSFKFCSQGDWNGTNYGAGAEAGQLSTDGGATNIQATTEGLVYITVNTETLSWTATPITSYSLIGSFNGWTDLDMTPNEDKTIWTATVTLGEGNEWKMRANHGWDINLGGDIHMLTNGGANIKSEPGTYTVTLNISTVPYTVTLTK